MPTFYYRGNDTNEDGSSGDNVEIKFADGPFEDSVKWDTNILIGAYELYKDDNNKLHSISGVFSTLGISCDDMNSYANNMGKGYQLIDWRMHCVIGCLFYALYGNTNSRKIIGIGRWETSEKFKSGYSNKFGVKDTTPDIATGGEIPVSFLGIENWCGGNYELIGDIKSIGNDYVLIKSNDIHEDRKFLFSSVKSGFNYGVHYRFGKYLDLSSDKIDKGNDNIYYCDINYGENEEGYSGRRAFDFINNGGISTLVMDILSYVGNADYTSRLAFRGICTKAESVETFKSLPVL